MLNPDFRDMLSCLKDEGVEFIVVGAYALAAHGYPRATGDIDIWVNNTPANARKVFRALTSFGAPLSSITEDDFTSADAVVQLGVEPCRVDILTGIDGVSFREAWEAKVPVEVDGIGLFILSVRDLLRNKVASGRDKDQSDIAWLKKNLADA